MTDFKSLERRKKWENLRWHFGIVGILFGPVFKVLITIVVLLTIVIPLVVGAGLLFHYLSLSAWFIKQFGWQMGGFIFLAFFWIVFIFLKDPILALACRITGLSIEPSEPRLIKLSTLEKFFHPKR